MAVNTTTVPSLSNLTISRLNTSENGTIQPHGQPQTTIIVWQDVRDNFNMANYIILPTFLVIGLFENSLTILMMISKEFRSLTSRYILICLALSDTTLILTQPFNKLIARKLIGYDIRALSDTGCKAFLHIFKTAKMTSSWLIVLLCFERFIAVVFPLKAKFVITKKTIIALIALDYLFIGTFNAVWTFSSIIVDGICKPDVMYPETKQKYRDFLLVGSSFYSLIPMIIMAILTPIIVTKLIVQRNRRRRMASGKGTSRNDADTIRISAMLIGVVVAYVVFILPITVVHNLAFWKGVSAFDTNTFDFFVLREVAQMFEQFNYSTNFFLYVLCSTKFRGRVFEILRIQKLLDYKKKRSVSSSGKTNSANQPPSSGSAVDRNGDKQPQQTENSSEAGKENAMESVPAEKRNQHVVCCAVNPDAIFINSEPNNN